VTCTSLSYNPFPQLEVEPGVDYTALSADELAITCFQSGDELAWAEFVRRFQPLIARVAVRVARQWGESSPQLVDELVQNTYFKICADRKSLLQKFAPNHQDAIYGYIKVLTANLAHDHFKASRSQKRGGWAIASSIDGDDRTLNARCLKSAEALIQRDILIQQVDACLQVVSTGECSGRDRKIFWLYYRVGLAASAIAALPTVGLSTKGVESIILRLTRLIRERLGDPPVAGLQKGAKGFRR
jgi:RNA polymerase sigma-70 factor, ECF subfamily